MEIVQTEKIYSLGQTKTNKGFKLKYGQDERSCRYEFISNQAFDDKEFNDWKDIVTKCKMLLPTFHSTDVKEKDIQHALQFQYKDNEMDYIINEKKNLCATEKNEKIAKSKVELLKQKEEAKLENNVKKLNEINDKINELDKRQYDNECKKVGKFSIFSVINQKNREKTLEAVFHATKKEKKLN
jgi:RNA polymerase-associated protein RTF1